jgi:hypothetical protein
MVFLRKWNTYTYQVEHMMRQLKDQGGLGIQNIEIQNHCLHSKWLFKLINEDRLWQTIIRNKYLTNQTIGKAQKNQATHFSGWANEGQTNLPWIWIFSFK